MYYNPRTTKETYFKVYTDTCNDEINVVKYDLCKQEVQLKILVDILEKNSLKESDFMYICGKAFDEYKMDKLPF